MRPGLLAEAVKPVLAPHADRMGGRARDGSLCGLEWRTPYRHYGAGGPAPTSHARFGKDRINSRPCATCAPPRRRSWRSPSSSQMGGDDHHLRSIRRIHRQQVTQVRDAVGRYLPLGTRVTGPQGALFSGSRCRTGWMPSRSTTLLSGRELASPPALSSVRRASSETAFGSTPPSGPNGPIRRWKLSARWPKGRPECGSTRRRRERGSTLCGGRGGCRDSCYIVEACAPVSTTRHESS